MNFSFVVPQQKRRSKVPRKLLTLPAKSQVEVESEVFFFSHFSTALRACKRNSVGFGCSVDKRSLAATLGSSGNANVFNARPRKRETERASDRE